MLRSWLGTLVFRCYVRAVRRRLRAGRDRESRAEGLLRRAREALIRGGDCVAFMRVGRQSLAMPLSHQLPVYRATCASLDQLLPNLARAHQAAGVELVFVDVGANVGDTAALVHDVAPDARFVCIEGHARYAGLLRANIASLGIDAEVIEACCGDGTGGAWAVTDDEHGTARLARGGVDVAVPLMTTLDQVSSESARARSVTVLKIDTDGWDLRVLRGAAALIRERHPIVYLEWHPALLREGGDDPASLFPMLASAGYTHARLYGNRGIPLATRRLAPDLGVESEARIDGKAVEYLDILAWRPEHDAVIAQLMALEGQQA